VFKLPDSIAKKKSDNWEKSIMGKNIAKGNVEAERHVELLTEGRNTM